MKTKICMAMLLLVFCNSHLSAQKKKTATTAKKATTTTTVHNNTATKSTGSKSAFYKTPYNSRNNGTFDKSTHLVSLTYGFPNTLDYVGFFYGDNSTSLGPVSFRYEFPIRDEAGVGIAVSGATKKYDFNDGVTTKIKGISVSPLGFYHFNKLIPVPKLDVFAGVGASVNIISYSDNDDNNDDDNNVDVEPAGMIGARYYFTNNFSGMAEVGTGSFSVFRIGLSLRL